MSNKIEYHKSVGRELMSLKDRVRNLLGDGTHWPSDGKFKEAILKSVLSRHLPENIGVYNGFSTFQGNFCSTEIDLILSYRDKANLFKQDDFIITTPSNIFGAIEVKTEVRSGNLKQVLLKLANNASLIRKESRIARMQSNLFESHSGKVPWFGLFSYDWQFNSNILNQFNNVAQGDVNRVVDCACLGTDYFVRFWDSRKMDYTDEPFTGWELYKLEGLAVSYFIANMIWQDEVTTIESENWFPLPEGKSPYIVNAIPFSPVRF